MGLLIHLQWGESDTALRRLITALFEEPLKISVGLLLTLFFWRRDSLSLPILAGCLAISGVAFAAYEHVASYADESARSLALRLVSHPTYPVLGLVIAGHQQRTQVSTLSLVAVAVGFHALNNLLSIISVIGGWSAHGWIAKMALTVGMTVAITVLWTRRDKSPIGSAAG